MRYKIAALTLGVLILVLIIGQLIDYSTFSLALPLLDYIDANDAVAQWLGTYRAIDILAQVTLLLAAVMGASAMFRTAQREVE
ncbi:MAG: hypothetical protein JW779_00245 [Candidatus Thorarchaeota archaeon]|nr:hypothetical protein [Candidatus Thorarchaeota archaeon]